MLRALLIGDRPPPIAAIPAPALACGEDAVPIGSVRPPLPMAGGRGGVRGTGALPADGVQKGSATAPVGPPNPPAPNPPNPPPPIAAPPPANPPSMPPPPKPPPPPPKPPSPNPVAPCAGCGAPAMLPPKPLAPKLLLVPNPPSEAEPSCIHPAGAVEGTGACDCAHPAPAGEGAGGSACALCAASTLPAAVAFAAECGASSSPAAARGAAAPPCTLPLGTATPALLAGPSNAAREDASARASLPNSAVSLARSSASSAPSAGL
mmetsp:Transcript_23136/g.58722  ORF Transcript_23136/g.58722 Transcript_23136/m.58722 type:complete len:264 (-) Transcript_23136:1162-1953(-)